MIAQRHESAFAQALDVGQGCGQRIANLVPDRRQYAFDQGRRHAGALAIEHVTRARHPLLLRAETLQASDDVRGNERSLQGELRAGGQRLALFHARSERDDRQQGGAVRVDAA
jgi:hypothetical protein